MRSFRLHTFFLRSVCIVFSCTFSYSLHAENKCVGRMVNPITDVCWKCIFPIRISKLELDRGDVPDTENDLDWGCMCTKGGIELPGIPISLWEPVRLADVTRTPFCLVNLGGVSIADTGVKGRGDIEIDTDTLTKRSFYHVHWYVYPMLYWFEILMDVVCLEAMSVDLAYMTEIDPLWADDEKNAIFSPEAILFGNPIAQAACAADGVASTFGMSKDALFWCAGSWGGIYPFGGTVEGHQGGVQASSLIVTRLMAKLHRLFLMWGTTGKEAWCKKYFMPIMKKSQYRMQLIYPKPQTNSCHPLGKNPFSFQAGQEFPFKGSDFGYLVWRKRECCMRARLT